MDSNKFIDMCILLVCEEAEVNSCDVFVVWSCKTLQNNKALLSHKTKGASYYEITYNGDKSELYVDVYDKRLNYKVEVSE